MKEINIIIRVDEITGKIGVIERHNLNKYFRFKIDQELYLHGIYGYLLSKSNNKFKFSEIFKNEYGKM